MNRLARLLYRAATLLLPSEFRRRNATELDTLFAEALERAAARGPWAWTFAVLRGLSDVAKQAIRIRAAGRQPIPRADSRPNQTMESTVQDVRFACRSLAKSPGFTLTAIAMIAIGIGANTSLFSVINVVLLRAPRHVERPDRLVSIYTSDFSGPAYGASSIPDFFDFRAQTPALLDAAALRPGTVSIPTDAGASETLVAEVVSGNYFELLGVPMARGRAFTLEETAPASGAAVAVLGHGFWTRRFGGDQDVIGRSLRVSGQVLTIVGVAPEGFGGLVPLVTPELWIPLSTQALIEGGGGMESRGSRGWLVVARLAEGATAAAAQDQLASLTDRLRADYSDAWVDVSGATRRVTVVDDVGLPPQIRGVATGFAALLLSILVITLMIACANIANLTLARSARRKREVAMKVALGASRGRILRQQLAESVVVGVAGGTAGVALALWITGAARALPPIAGVDLTLDLGLDRNVLLFSAALTSLTIVAVGLLPALRASHTDPAHVLKGGAADGSGPSRWLDLRRLLVTGQVAASLVLLVGAGLAVKSMRAAVRIDPGFAVQDVATLSVRLGPEGYSREETHELVETLAASVARLPGVVSVSYTDALPLTPAAAQRRGVSIPGYEPSPAEDMEFQFLAFGPGLVDALDMELLSGREFTRGDNSSAARVVLVNESFAQRFWPGDDPLGKVVTSGGREAQVVGLIRDALYRDLQDTGRPAFFMPVGQSPNTSLTLVARTTPGRAEELLPLMRGELARLDDRLPVATLQTMEEAVAVVVLPRRIASLLLSVAGALGMLLAAAGLYGVVSFLISQRTREIGLRIALGARARDVVAGIVRREVAFSAVGVGLGLGVAAVATRLLQSLLFNVSPLDASVFTLTAIAALVVTAVASWIPARRASTVDPMVALRSE